MSALNLDPSAKPKSQPKPKKKKQRKPKVRYAPLTGKLALPRGRQSGSEPAIRDVVTIPVSRRLGYRIKEYAALTGVSEPTVWRGIKAGTIETADVHGITVVTRRHAIRTGLIDATDNV